MFTKIKEKTDWNCRKTLNNVTTRKPDWVTYELSKFNVQIWKHTQIFNKYDMLIKFFMHTKHVSINKKNKEKSFEKLLL